MVVNQLRTGAPFWDAPLGRPVGEKGQLYKNKNGVSIEGFFIREFTNGWAVYNRSGKEQTIVLPNQATGVASDQTRKGNILSLIWTVRFI